ncbi:MAG TPA: peptidylprolyl isomerase [Candidatus Cloacimonadota bacterium]|nr:peptidylprolyl isomerase [Candidatus Cloacimonadota bacterium]
MKKVWIIICIMMILMPFSLHARRFARWYTSMGQFTAVIRNDIMPITGNNFIELAQTYFYDNLVFHRVVEGFVIQDGCPNGTGTGGPGYTIPDEYSPLILHDAPGVLAMAKTSQPNSAGSQYYITLDAFPHLDGNYAAFGKVIDGMSVVFDISHVPVNANSHPLVDVVIDSLRILGLEINSISPADTVLTTQVSNDLSFFVDAYDVNQFVDANYEWYIDNELIQNAQSSEFVTQFSQTGEHLVKCIVSDADVDYPIIWHVHVNPLSTDEDIVQSNMITSVSSYPNPFYQFVSLSYQLKKQDQVKISIYDIKGRLVNPYHHVASRSGENTWQWNGLNQDNQMVSNGIYLYRIESNGAAVSGKMIMMK